ncbi:MAG: ABC transporter substrate-binding protein [Myxococcota bacterium]
MSHKRSLFALLVALLSSILWVERFDHPAPAAKTPVAGAESSGPERIVSGSTRADQVLWRLIESGFDPDRVIAVTGYSRRSGPPFDRFGAVERLQDLEVVLSHRPELLLANGVGDGRAMARLRAEGVEVLDLGPLGGLDSFLEDILEIGRAVGAETPARTLARDFEQAMRAVAADVPADARPGGLVLIPYGDALFGGALGSSYHDVLKYGGLRDVATEAGFTGWPRLAPEQVLGLDPQWILTQAPEQVCASAIGPQLSACPERVVALSDSILGDPGLGMLRAASALRRHVHGMPPAP